MPRELHAIDKIDKDKMGQENGRNIEIAHVHVLAEFL